MPPTSQILVVDDEDSVRFVVSELLRSRGYEVTLAKNAREAMAVLAQRRTDLVVLDIELENENGLELLAAIKQIDPRVRVVILTGRGYDDQLWQIARQNAADGYISKTLPPSQLLMEVNRWMQHGEKEREAGSSPRPNS